MANWDDRTRQSYGSVPRAGGDVASRTTFDAGLRKYMLSIYNYMASGVLLTGIVSVLFYNSPFFGALFQIVQTPQGTSLSPTLLGWVIMLAKASSRRALSMRVVISPNSQIRMKLNAL